MVAVLSETAIISRTASLRVNREPVVKYFRNTPDPGTVSSEVSFNRSSRSTRSSSTWRYTSTSTASLIRLAVGIGRSARQENPRPESRCLTTTATCPLWRDTSGLIRAVNRASSAANRPPLQANTSTQTISNGLCRRILTTRLPATIPTRESRSAPRPGRGRPPPALDHPGRIRIANPVLHNSRG